MKRRENEGSPKVYAIVVFFGFLVYLGTIIILLTTFLPQMESAAEETRSLMEETGGEGAISIIQDDYIPEIELVYTLSLICFGLLDGIFALLLWKSKVPNRLKKILMRVLAEAYLYIRSFSLIIMVMLSITILVRSTSRFFMNLLYFVIPTFSVISLIFILYFHRKVLGEKIEEEYVFKIPDEAAF